MPIAQQGDPEERLRAAHALALIEAAPETALEAVRGARENPRVILWEDRALATLVQLAGFYQPAVSELIPLLTQTREDRETGQQVWLIDREHLESLGRRFPDDPRLAAALQQVALRHSWSETREAAFVALQQVDPEAASEIASEYYDRLAKKKHQEQRR